MALRGRLCPSFAVTSCRGGTYFFTVVTAKRALIFQSEEACSLLGACLREAKQRRPFHVVAVVLLPDHLHMIWTLPADDLDFSTRLASVKARFTQDWLARGGSEGRVAPGQARQRRRGVWQARFMEHTIRNEDDLIHHADYIHFNPVRHGWAQCPGDWPYSSFRRYVQSGVYPAEWGCSQRLPTPTFGMVRESLIE